MEPQNEQIESDYAADDYLRDYGPEDDPMDTARADRSEFQDPGGRSALRAATPSNPRNLPCPTCGKPNRLTPKDRQHGYQCDECADRAEGGGW